MTLSDGRHYGHSQTQGCNPSFGSAHLLSILLRLADELRDGLRGRLFEVLDPNSVQGAHLQFDSYWYRSYLRDRFGPDWAKWANNSPWDFKELPKSFEQEWGSYRPSDWKEHCRYLGYQTHDADQPSPVILRVTLHDPGDLARLGIYQSFVPPTDRHKWPRSFRGHAIVYEIGPPAIGTSTGAWPFRSRRPHQALDGPGVSLGRSDPNSSGTACLALLDSAAGRRYAVTCAHVVGPVGTEVYSPGPFEHGPSKRVGFVRFSRIPPLGAGLDCGFDQHPDAGRLDVSLVELDEEDFRLPTHAHHVRAIQQMAQEQPVVHHGKESGPKKARIAALTAWQAIYTEDFGEGPPGFRCFGGLFQLMGRRGDLTGIAKPGDSGALITDSQSGLTSWDGILVARQDTRAYGCFAELAFRAFRQDRSLPANLVLPTL